MREGVVRWLSARDRASLLRVALGTRDPRLAALARCIRMHQFAWRAHCVRRARPFAAEVAMRMWIPYSETIRWVPRKIGHTTVELGTFWVLVDRIYRYGGARLEYGIEIRGGTSPLASGNRADMLVSSRILRASDVTQDARARMIDFLASDRPLARLEGAPVFKRNGGGPASDGRVYEWMSEVNMPADDQITVSCDVKRRMLVRAALDAGHIS